MDSSSTAALVVRNGSGEGGEERMKNELSEDNILEILMRLPVKSLMRFKCVSKNWYSLILSPTLVAMHITNTSHKNTVSLFQRWHHNTGTSTSTTLRFEFGYVPKKLKLAGSWDYIHIVGCSNGVVCLSLSRLPRQNKYALWNPATRQVRLIEDGPPRQNKYTVWNSTTRQVRLIEDGPPRQNKYALWNPATGQFGLMEETSKKTTYHNSGFCFDSSANSFKLALFNLTSTERGKQFQVNLFSTATSTWTEKSQGLPDQFLSMGKCISVNGSVHRSAMLYDHGRCILSYNMIDEAFKRTPLPFPALLVNYWLTDYKGSLAVFVCNAPREVWVLNACGGAATQSWSKLLTISPSINMRYAGGVFTNDNVDLVLLTEKNTCFLYLYDPMNGETKKFWKTFPVLDTFPYHESIASLH